MPRVIVTAIAAQGLDRCRLFLGKKNPIAALRASQSIEHAFSLLKSDPEIGRPITESIELRELIIPFGDSGYVALYRFSQKDNSVYILAFRHQKEADYH